MPATNSNALDTQPWKIYIAEWDSSIPTYTKEDFEADTSKILEVRDALDLLTYKRLASVVDTNVTDDLGANILRDTTDDNSDVYVSVEPEITATGSFKEFENDVLSLLTNTSTLDVAGTPVPVPWEALWTGWTIWQPIKLAKKNGDNTEVASIIIDADGTPLTIVTDYSAYVWDWTNWELWHTYIVPVTAQTWVLDADYTYTPNASTLWYSIKEWQEMTRLVVKIVSLYTPTLAKTHYISDSSFQGQLMRQIADVNRAGQVWTSPFNFTANRGWLHIWNDAVNV